jgi:hypothetical protein
MAGDWGKKVGCFWNMIMAGRGGGDEEEKGGGRGDYDGLVMDLSDLCESKRRHPISASPLLTFVVFWWHCLPVRALRTATIVIPIATLFPPRS